MDSIGKKQKNNIKKYIEYLKQFGKLPSNAKIKEIYGNCHSARLDIDIYKGPKDWDRETQYLYIDYNIMNAQSEKDILSKAKYESEKKPYVYNENGRKFQIRQSIKQYARNARMTPKEYIALYPGVVEAICKTYGVKSFDYEAGDGIYYKEEDRIW